ncbi:hypothetical protein [Bailinhaonella thermotolerans]|uniref:hypothetical protein n=1 Tax=Bailinhaonella thermotolerans TaxID=1070861 RepID=UPI00192A3DB3|nr:hypothetical protein [Bailinhaonella thermotolerans]
MSEMTREDMRARLAEIDREIAQLRGELGGQLDGPVDAVDSSQNLQAYEEQMALIANLEAQRSALRERLGED